MRGSETEFVLQIQNALADMQAGSQFLGIEGLRQVIIGTECKTLEKILFVSAGS